MSAQFEAMARMAKTRVLSARLDIDQSASVASGGKGGSISSPPARAARAEAHDKNPCAERSACRPVVCI